MEQEDHSRRSSPFRVVLVRDVSQATQLEIKARWKSYMISSQLSWVLRLHPFREEVSVLGLVNSSGCHLPFPTQQRRLPYLKIYQTGESISRWFQGECCRWEIIPQAEIARASELSQWTFSVNCHLSALVIFGLSLTARYLIQKRTELTLLPIRRLIAYSINSPMQVLNRIGEDAPANMFITSTPFNRDLQGCKESQQMGGTSHWGDVPNWRSR